MFGQGPTMKIWVLFDWGDTLMRVFPEAKGKMKDWKQVAEMPGARPALRSLHGQVGLALATNAADSDEEDIRAALARVDLDAFMKRVFCQRALGVKKGDPDFFRQALEGLHIDPEHAVMVGDDWAEDVQSARAAGLRAVWFNHRNTESRTAEHVTTIHHLEALPGVLMGWGLLKRS